VSATAYHRRRRDEAIRRARARGWTLARIGARFGLTKQRVGQILAEQNGEQ